MRRASPERPVTAAFRARPTQCLQRPLAPVYCPVARAFPGRSASIRGERLARSLAAHRRDGLRARGRLCPRGGSRWLPRAGVRPRAEGRSPRRAPGHRGHGPASPRSGARMATGSSTPGKRWTPPCPPPPPRAGSWPRRGLRVTASPDHSSRPAHATMGTWRRVPLEGIRVLAVDDDPDTLDFLCFVLEREGALVTCVDRSEDALARLKAATESDRPHVLISDLAMPKKDGVWLLKAIRALPADQGGAVPALALTAFTSQATAEPARRSGVPDAAHQAHGPRDPDRGGAHPRRGWRRRAAHDLLTGAS